LRRAAAGNAEAAAMRQELADLAAAAVEAHGCQARQTWLLWTLGRIAAEGREVTAVEVGEAAAAGDPEAGAILEQAGRMLGVALTSLANAFEPEVIVIGGGGMALGDRLLDPARQVLSERALDPMSKTPIVAAELGPAAGMIGGATLARSLSGGAG
ncbi:MAG: ROK family protein, partial [Solirubrobacterales bacterium]